MANFVAKIIGNTEDTWGKIFANLGQQDLAPKLVLFSGQTPNVCGSGQA
jgi:predicted metalloprotease